MDGSVGQLVPQERFHDASWSRRWLFVIQPVLVERIKDRVADQMVDIPVPPAMENRTRAAADRRAHCKGAYSTIFLVTMSESSRLSHRSNFQEGAVNRQWTSLFRRLTCLKLFIFKFV